MLNDRVALVTGSSRGIGAAIALEMAKQGASVIGTATTEAGVQKINQAFKAVKGSGQGMLLDITQLDSIEQLISNIQATTGRTPDILVNNAGITQDTLMLRMKEDEWLNVINTNLNAVFHLTKICIKSMVKARWGRVINIGSVVASTGNPGQANYCAAKAGVIGFSKALAFEVATRGVTVNVVSPGFIETDMTDTLTESQKNMILERIPMKKIGSTSDIAYMVAYLASEKASYMTGQTIHINGGMYVN